MEQLKRNLPYILFIALGLKLIALGSNSIFDVLSLFVLGLGLAFFELRLENKKFSELTSKINDLESKNTKNTQEIEILNKTITSVKAVTGMKQVYTK